MVGGLRLGHRADVLARFGDQAVVSVGNFAMAVVMARLLGPGQFGQFALLWTLVMLALGVHWALLSSPMQNTLAAAEPAERPALLPALGLHALAIAAIGALLIPIVFSGLAPQALAGATLVAMAMAGAAIVMQEFTRRWLLATERPAVALTSDLMRHLGGLALLATCGAMGLASLAFGLVALALGALLALAPLALDLRGLQGRPGLSRALARQHADTGRWLLPSVLLQTVVSGAPLYLATASVGAAAAGGYRAVYNLMTPIVSLTEALETFLPLRAAAAYQRGGREGLATVILRWGLPLGLGCMVFVLAVWALGASLLRFAFGADYAVYAPAMLPLALAMLLQFSTYLFNVRLRAIGSTRAIFVADLASGIALVLLLLVVPIDPHGRVVASALACAQAVKLAVLVWSDLRHAQRPMSR